MWFLYLLGPSTIIVHALRPNPNIAGAQHSVLTWGVNTKPFGKRHTLAITLNRSGHLKVETKCIRKLHLPWGLALHLKQSRVRDKHGYALSARGRDVETIRAVEEFHSSRSVFGSRCGHRVDHDWSLLSLKLINCANS